MKRLFFYISTTLLVTNLLTHITMHAALTRAEAAADFGKSLLMPWRSTRAFENKVNSFTTALAVVANACEWVQPLQTRKAYLKASKNQNMRRWVSFYDFIWFTKKSIACHEIYRISSRFHWESHNPLQYAISLLKIITIFGDRIIDPEQLEKTSKMIWAKRAKQPKGT